MNDMDVVLLCIRAYNAKDVSGTLAFFDEDCLFENISGGKVTVRAKDKARPVGVSSLASRTGWR